MPKKRTEQYEIIRFSRAEIMDLILNSLEDKIGFKVDFTLGRKLGQEFVDGATCTRVTETI